MRVSAPLGAGLRSDAPAFCKPLFAHLRLTPAPTAAKLEWSNPPKGGER